MFVLLGVLLIDTDTMEHGTHFGEVSFHVSFTTEVDLTAAIGTTACLLILATVRSNHLTPPLNWELLIRRHITTLKYWESEATDVGSARLILEGLLKNSVEDLT